MSSFKLVFLIAFASPLVTLSSGDPLFNVRFSGARSKRHSNLNPFAVHKSPSFHSVENENRHGSEFLQSRPTSILGPGPKHFKSRPIEEHRQSNPQSFRPLSHQKEEHHQDVLPEEFDHMQNIEHSNPSPSNYPHSHDSSSMGSSSQQDIDFAKALKKYNEMWKNRQNPKGFYNKFVLGSVENGAKEFESRHHEGDSRAPSEHGFPDHLRKSSSEVIGNFHGRSPSKFGKHNPAWRSHSRFHRKSPQEKRRSMRLAF